MIRIIVFIHFLVLILGIIATLMTIRREPLYLSFLMVVLLTNLIFNGCILTQWENYHRRKQGLPEVSFTEDYLWTPIRKWLAKK